MRRERKTEIEESIAQWKAHREFIQKLIEAKGDVMKALKKYKNLTKKNRKKAAGKIISRMLDIDRVHQLRRN